MLVRQLPDLPHLVFDLKLDGWRTVATVGEQVELQTRSGRVVTTQFPEVLPALAVLPAGTVLDGELVAVRGGRFDFHALAGSAATRRRSGAAVSYVAFDLLADAGVDTARLPLVERRERLARLLDGHSPGVEMVKCTMDRGEALAWLEVLTPLGVEGLVAKDSRRAYRPGVGHGWFKYRPTDTEDATLVGVVGSGIKPDALRVRLADGREAATEPLTDSQRRELVEGVRAVGEAPILVEVRVTGAGSRHEQVAFVRVRLD